VTTDVSLNATQQVSSRRRPSVDLLARVGESFLDLALLRLCVGDCAHRKSPVSQLAIAVVNPEWASAIDQSPFSICSMSCDRRAVNAAHQQASRRRPIRHCDVLVAIQGRGRRVGDCQLRGRPSRRRRTQMPPIRSAAKRTIDSATWPSTVGVSRMGTDHGRL
jgi:hypothetical protein